MNKVYDIAIKITQELIDAQLLNEDDESAAIELIREVILENEED